MEEGHISGIEVMVPVGFGGDIGRRIFCGIEEGGVIADRRVSS